MFNSNDSSSHSLDHLLARFKRYASITRTAGGLALVGLLEKLRQGNLDHERQAHELRRALGALKGPVMKVAQFLATIPEAIPPEYAQALLELQSQAPPMGGLFVQRRMTSELGTEWRENFAEFELNAAAAASLGQVHKARGKDGKLLACKLQYPNMEAALATDLQQLQLLLAGYELVTKALMTEGIQHEIRDRLYEELNYQREGRVMAYYRHILAPYSNIVVPQYYPELSTKRLLTMDWVEGQSLHSCETLPQVDRNRIAATLFTAWYAPLYHHGIIHGDPHLGNYLIGVNQEVKLLDFGCVRIFSGQFIQGVIELYRSFVNNDHELAVHAYRLWGFEQLNSETIEILNWWARLLYDPLLDNRIRPIQVSAAIGRETAYKVHQALAAAGGIKPPREFVFMDRAAVGVGSALLRLGAELNWHDLFNDLIKDFDAAKIVPPAL